VRKKEALTGTILSLKYITKRLYKFREEKVNKIEAVLKALADEKRLRIVKLLERHPLCVCEIAFVLGITQPAVSKHLKKMKDAGIIGCEQDGFWTNYYLTQDNAHVKNLLKNVKSWLADEAQIKKDLMRVQQADRSRLCCRK